MFEFSTFSLERIQFARRRAMQLGLFTFIMTTFLMSLAFINHDEGILTFAWTGITFTERDPEKNITVSGDFDGYDGQFAYYIARFGTDADKLMDNPPFRYMRIMYPLIAGGVSLGNDAIVPYLLVAINILAHSVGAALVTYLLALYRSPAILGGLIFATWIGGLYGVRLNLTEPLTIAFALTAVAAYVHQRFLLAILLLILAMLTKEFAIVFVAGLAIHAFFNGKRIWGIAIAIVPLIAFLAWLGVLRLWFGSFPTSHESGQGLRFIPFGGFIEELDRNFLPIEIGMTTFWLVIPTIILTLIALWQIWQRRQISLGVSLTLMAAGFVMIMPGVTWVDSIAVYRVGMPIVIAGILLIGQHYKKQLLWFAAIWMPSFVFLLMISWLWFG